MRVIPLPIQPSDEKTIAVVIGDTVFVPDRGSESENLAAAARALECLHRQLGHVTSVPQSGHLTA